MWAKRQLKTMNEREIFHMLFLGNRATHEKLLMSAIMFESKMFVTLLPLYARIYYTAKQSPFLSKTFYQEKSGKRLYLGVNPARLARRPRLLDARHAGNRGGDEVAFSPLHKTVVFKKRFSCGSEIECDI